MHKITFSEKVKYFGSGAELSDGKLFVSDADDLKNIPERKDDSHKGTYGTALIIAGSKLYGGAPALSAEAALRSGCGMIKVYTHEDNRGPVLARLPECIVVCDDDLGVLEDQLVKADSLVLGPGLSMDERAKQITGMVLNDFSCPLIVDADALNIIASEHGGYRFPDDPTVIFTPHIGEAARLLGKEPVFIKENKLAAAKEIALKFNVITVLKDSVTFISDGESFIINPTGNSGMATAGSGDVLSGILGGVAARGLEGVDLVVTGVYLHGLAGDGAAARRGKSSMIASDIVKALSDVLKCHELI